MVRIRGLAGLAVVALAMTACSAESSPPESEPRRVADTSESTPESSPPGSPDGTPTQVGDECGDPMRLRADDALRPEHSGPIAGTSVLPDPSNDAIVRAIGPDGDVLQEVGRHDDTGTGPDSLHPGELSVLDPKTGATEPIRGRADIHDGTQTTFAALDEEYAVWLEQTSTDLTSADWTMYAADRDTGEISRVARATPIDDTTLPPAAPGYTIPSLSDGRVYWSETRPGRAAGDPPTVNVYARPLDLSAPADLVVEDAVTPVATGEWLYYIGFDPERFTEVEYAVYRLHLTTGETTLVHESAGGGKFSVGKAAYLTAYGDTVAWSLAESVVVFVGTEQVAEIRAPGELLVWLSAGPSGIGFEDGSGNPPGRNYLFDLSSGCLHNLGDGAGAGEVKIGGEHVLWSMPGKRKPAAETVWHYATLR